VSGIAELGFIDGNAGIQMLQDYMLLAVTGLYVRSNGLPNE
jgi:hypothetical protein